MNNIRLLDALLEEMNEARDCITQKHAKVTQLLKLAQDADKKRSLAARLTSLTTADRMLTDANALWREAVNATGDNDTLAVDKLAAATSTYNDVMTVLNSQTETPIPQPEKAEEETTPEAEVSASDPSATLELPTQPDEPATTPPPSPAPEPAKATEEIGGSAEPVSADSLKGLEERLTAALTGACQQGLAELRREIAENTLPAAYVAVLREMSPDELRRALQRGLWLDNTIDGTRMLFPWNRSKAQSDSPHN